jgi:cobalt-zinc-cadmium efflux system outer membrane protein
VLLFAHPAAGQRDSAPASGGAPTQSPVLTLSALLDSVRLAYPSVLAAQARVRAAQGARITAGRLGNPMLTYQVDGVSFGTARAVQGMDRETMITGMFPLEPIYLRGSRVARANADVRAAVSDAERERQETGLMAAHAFYRVALARLTVATGREVVAWLDSVVTYNQARVKEGVAAEADLYRSVLERDRAMADVAMARAELAQLDAQLGSFLGDGQARLTLAPGDVPLAIGTAGPDSIPGRRPGVRAARERVASAEATISTERRMLIRESGVMLGTKQMGGATSMLAGFSVPIPLFDQNRGEVGRASAERDVARFELATQERSARAELSGAAESARLLTRLTDELRAGGRASFLARADETRRIALGAYREGAVPLLQVLDAARAWGDARLTYFRALYAQHESVLALTVARGGDLYSTPLVPAPGAGPR